MKYYWLEVTSLDNEKNIYRFERLEEAKHALRYEYESNPELAKARLLEGPYVTCEVCSDFLPDQLDYNLAKEIKI